MFESFILGAVQGISEWLPISSEAMIVLVKTNFFPSGMSFSDIISFAIFLHLGTLLSVLVYYWRKVLTLIKQCFSYPSLKKEEKQYINFIVIATGVSGLIGLGLIRLVEYYEVWFQEEVTINILVAVFLAITAVFLYISENKKGKEVVALTTKRGLITGIFQGFSAIPGISRSGSTVAGMGLLGINKEQALELSFILSIPIVLLANIVLNLHEISAFSLNHIIAIGSAFVFGLLTIELLLQIVRRIRFSYFVGGFAAILIILSFVIYS